jgi:hypothetical protein
LIAISEKAMAAASVSMWPAPENSASELAMIPTTTSTSMKPTISARAIASLPRSASGLTP